MSNLVSLHFDEVTSYGIQLLPERNVYNTSYPICIFPQLARPTFWGE